MQKTKMVFTIGPACEDVPTLKKLMEIGMSASRHNFSHGDHEEHGGRIRNIKKLREELNKEIAIILDTKGPEIRTGVFEPSKVQVVAGTEFSVYCNEEVIGDATKCNVTYNGLINDVKPGNIILIDDGLVGLEVKAVEGNQIKCIVKNSGTIGTKKGVNVPGVSIQLPAITEKDKSDLIFGVEIGVDIIAASFIRKASDVLAIRQILAENGGEAVQIFSKIENQEGVDNLDEILALSDGIMVARGDMGVEIPMEQVPVVQKAIIAKCNAVGKPVITATQMLDSMMRNPRPTRAEVSDVANAILDGTDAVMLSGETANGSYPIEAATAMSTIAKETEKQINHEDLLRKKRKSHEKTIQNAIGLATCTTAQELDAAAIIVATQTGNSAKQMSSFRPKAPIVAVTPLSSVARKLNLHWGVTAIANAKYNTTDELIEKSADKALEKGLVQAGDLVVVAAGIPVHNSGTTNMMKVHIVGDHLIKE